MVESKLTLYKLSETELATLRVELTRWGKPPHPQGAEKLPKISKINCLDDRPGCRTVVGAAAYLSARRSLPLLLKDQVCSVQVCR